MKQYKLGLIIIACWSAILVLSAMIIPGMLVKQQSINAANMNHEHIQSSELVHLIEESAKHVVIPVLITRENRIEAVPLETYVRGVIAAEMPIEFELEALKAQAIAARTYIVRRLMYEDDSNVPASDALVTDTVAHQAYINLEQLQSRWDQQAYVPNMIKLNRAVNETAGMIVTYNGEPIQAMFFSTSNGYSENSEDYFRDEIPYLRSVASPWDVELSPKYEQQTTLSVEEVRSKLGINAQGKGQIKLQIMKKTASQRIEEIQVDDVVLSGREVREKLALPSSHFVWKLQKENITFTTYGYGHGVGMSQYGAQGMALQGKGAADIVGYYYQNVQLEQFVPDSRLSRYVANVNGE